MNGQAFRPEGPPSIFGSHDSCRDDRKPASPAAETKEARGMLPAGFTNPMLADRVRRGHALAAERQGGNRPTSRFSTLSSE